MAVPNKLTKAQREALQWFSERGPVGWFDRWAPTKITRDRLEKAGLIERVGKPQHFMAAVEYQISTAGRLALSDSKENDRG